MLLKDSMKNRKGGGTMVCKGKVILTLKRLEFAVQQNPPALLPPPPLSPPALFRNLDINSATWILSINKFTKRFPWQPLLRCIVWFSSYFVYVIEWSAI